MRHILLIMMLTLLGNLCYGTVILVPEDFATIQAGINGASSGDTVIVGPKRYYGEGNRDLTFGGKSLVLLSNIGRDGTMIDCEGMGRAMTLQEGDGPITIDGFTLYGGQASGAGGILCEKAILTVKNSTIRKNIGEGSPKGGGGIYAIESAVELVNCTVDSNELDVGMFVHGAGGISAFYYSTISVTNCIITDNIGEMVGGGMYISNSTICNIENSYFCRNHVEYVDSPKRDGGGAYGGGIAVFSSSVCSLRTCILVNNSSEQFGGAIHCSNSEVYAENITAVGNVCAEDGSAIYSGGELSVENSLIAFNENDEAIVCSGTIDISCTNIFGNGGDWVGCIEDLAGSNENMSEDPLLCSLTPDNLGITSDSPCYPFNNSCNELIGALGLGCVSICGDTDDSFDIDIDDVVYLVAFIFQSGPPPMPLPDGNVDCSEGSPSVDIDDVVYMIQYIFFGGPEPCADCL